MFVLMGDILAAATPIGRDLFRAAHLLLRKLPWLPRGRYRLRLRGFWIGMRVEPGNRSDDRADVRAGDAAPRLRQSARARRDRRRRNARHSDSPERFDDHLRDPHRHLDRQAVHSGNRSRPDAGLHAVGDGDPAGSPQSGTGACICRGGAAGRPASRPGAALASGAPCISRPRIDVRRLRDADRSLRRRGGRRDRDRGPAPQPDLAGRS